MSEIYRDKYHALSRLPGKRAVRLTRTSSPFASAEEIRATFGRLHPLLDSCKRLGLGLLVDSRDAPVRTDAGFDAVHGPERARVVSGFRAVAVLMRSITGRWQASKQSKAGGIAVFGNEDEALAFLSEEPLAPDADPTVSGFRRRPSTGAMEVPDIVKPFAGVTVRSRRGR